MANQTNLSRSACRLYSTRGTPACLRACRWTSRSRLREHGRLADGPVAAARPHRRRRRPRRLGQTGRHRHSRRGARAQQRCRANPARGWPRAGARPSPSRAAGPRPERGRRRRAPGTSRSSPLQRVPERRAAAAARRDSSDQLRVDLGAHVSARFRRAAPPHRPCGCRPLDVAAARQDTHLRRARLWLAIPGHEPERPATVVQYAELREPSQGAALLHKVGVVGWISTDVVR